MIDLSPCGYIMDVPPGLPPDHCRFTLIYQVEVSSYNFDGLGFTRDQVIDCVQVMEDRWEGKWRGERGEKNHTNFCTVLLADPII